MRIAPTRRIYPEVPPIGGFRWRRVDIALLTAHLAFSLGVAACSGDATERGVVGKYVGMLTADTFGTSRSILDLREDGSATWTLLTGGSPTYAVRADTVFLSVGGVLGVVRLVASGDSLIWQDQRNQYGVWLKAEP